MSVRATAAEHIAEAKTVTLAEDGTLDFDLRPIPRAALTFDGVIKQVGCTSTSCALEGLYGMTARAAPAVSAEPCSSIRGRARCWRTLDPTQMVRPGERTPFEGCCYSRSRMFTVSDYHNPMTWENTICP
jgi:hypothetical protein